MSTLGDLSDLLRYMPEKFREIQNFTQTVAPFIFRVAKDPDTESRTLISLLVPTCRYVAFVARAQPDINAQMGTINRIFDAAEAWIEKRLTAQDIERVYQELRGKVTLPRRLYAITLAPLLYARYLDPEWRMTRPADERWGYLQIGFVETGRVLLITSVEEVLDLDPANAAEHCDRMSVLITKRLATYEATENSQA